ncbi:MAG: siderophore ferric iron reductase [Vogesella sp.]|uniref:siderophore ferric iron reductase n=1 Tax=Vogesella sp. TaxID=1904252 RepID=UPI00391B2522
MPAPRPLAAVLQDVARLLPALHGRIAALPAAQPGLSAALLQYWHQQQAEAGPHYWAARSWSMLIWQPAYLSVLAVHTGHAALQLHGLQQDVHNGTTAGFSLPMHQPATGDEPQLIALAAAQLLAYQQQHLPLLQAGQAYSGYLASCMTVDCVLSALQMAAQDAGWCPLRQQQLAASWLQALQLTRHGNLMQVAVAPGQCRTALARKGCCQHFRLSGAEACCDCPRWPMPERLQRIRQQWQLAANP